MDVFNGLNAHLVLAFLYSEPKSMLLESIITVSLLIERSDMCCAEQDN